MLKVRTLFSGIGSPESALKNLQIPYELIDFCEVDKYAVKSYCAVHGVSKDKNLGDITKVWGRNLPYADLLVWGFPCTDISVAGKQSGIIEGETRSGLYFEGFRVLKETKPKYSIIENVKNLTGKKFKAEFEQMLQDIEGLGYNNYYKVLNAKNYGIPQNRERVFIVSIRKDIDTGKFEFPIGFDNGLRLKDFLEDEVDENFYISQEKVEQLLKNIDNKIDLEKQVIGTCHPRNDLSFATRDRVYNEEKKSPTLTSTMYKDAPKIMVKEATKKGYAIATIGDSINLEQPNSLTRRGRIGHQIANTLTTSCNQAVVENKPVLVGGVGKINFGKQYRQGNRIYSSEAIAMCLCAQPVGNAGGNSYLYQVDYRIRKLTPKECWRLMGFTDEEFERAEKVNSNSQLYKQAGNSIVTNVLAAIFKNLLQSEITQIYEENKELS